MIDCDSSVGGYMIQIHYPDEETIEIIVDDEVVYWTAYDAVGWSGLREIETLVEIICKKTGEEVIYS